MFKINITSKNSYNNLEDWKYFIMQCLYNATEEMFSYYAFLKNKISKQSYII
jgi:hypothetical protein